MIIGGKDRSYYRMLTDADLVRTVQETTNPTELEKVLAERLEELSE